MKRLLLSLAAAVSLAACATTPTLYQPQGAPSAVGYSEYRLEPGRYRVTFHGGPGAPAAQVSDYALLRAAEITLRDGYDWFRAIDRMGEVTRPGGGSSLSIGTGTASYGRHSAVGFGLGTSFDLSGGPALARTLEIMLGKGPVPSGVDAYDASAVVREISPRAHPAGPA
jgi:hypothetical protein